MLIADLQFRSHVRSSQYMCKLQGDPAEFADTGARLCHILPSESGKAIRA